MTHEHFALFNAMPTFKIYITSVHKATLTYIHTYRNIHLNTCTHVFLLPPSFCALRPIFDAKKQRNLVDRLKENLFEKRERDTATEKKMFRICIEWKRVSKNHFRSIVHEQQQQQQQQNRKKTNTARETESEIFITLKCLRFGESI